MSQLDDLLESIDPKRTIDYYHALLDKSLNSYDFSNVRTGDRDEFRTILGNFWWHVESALLEVEPDDVSGAKHAEFMQRQVLHILTGLVELGNLEEVYGIVWRFARGSAYGWYCDERENLKEGRALTLAHEIALSGVEGGLYGLFRKIGEAMAKDHVDGRIRSEVVKFIDGLKGNVSEFKSTADEYVQRYGSLLPREALDKDVYDLMTGFRQILQNHPFLIKSLREVGRL